MRIMLRRRLVLPVLLVAIAAIAGGIFAGLGGPNPVEDTSAHTGDHTYFFRFLPPTGDDDTAAEGKWGWQRLNCGWHFACVGADDDSPRDLGVDFRGYRGDPLYLRGYGHTEEPGHTTHQPVTVRVFDWARGTYNNSYAPINCYTVEAVFFWTGTDSDAVPHVAPIGRYAAYHATSFANFSDKQGTNYAGQTYRPDFSSTGAWNGKDDKNFALGSVMPHDDDSCTSGGDHVHVTQDRNDRPDRPYSGNWIRNTDRYPTEEQTERLPVTCINPDCSPHPRDWPEYPRVNNTDPDNWTHQLCLSGDCPEPPFAAPLIYNPGVDLLFLEASNSTSIRVIWSVDADPPVISQKIRYKVAGGNWIPSDDGQMIGKDASPYSLTGLTPDTNYHVQVRATSNLGDGLWSSLATIKTPAVTPPGRPHDVNVSNRSQTTAQVSWEASTSGGGIRNGYEISRRAGLRGAWNNPVAVSGTSTTLGGLIADTLYYVRIRAKNIVDGQALYSNWSWNRAFRTDDTDGMDNPGAGTATVTVKEGSTTETETVISLTAPASSASGVSGASSLSITGYEVRRQAAASDDWIVTEIVISDCMSDGAESISCILTGLSPGTKYEIQARAVNQNGHGDWSTSISVTTLVAPSPIVSVTRTGSSTVSQSAAQTSAKAKARAALPSGTQGITVTIRDLPQRTTSGSVFRHARGLKHGQPAHGKKRGGEQRQGTSAHRNDKYHRDNSGSGRNRGPRLRFGHRDGNRLHRGRCRRGGEARRRIEAAIRRQQLHVQHALDLFG